MKNYAFNILFPLTQSKSKSQQEEVCTVSSIVLLLTLIGQDMEFVQLEFNYNFILNIVLFTPHVIR